MEATISARGESNNAFGGHFDWRQRPQELKKRINKAFNDIRDRPESSWGVFNGDSKYYMANVREHRLMKEIIQRSLRKEFCVLEIGAGNFQWGKSLANYLEKKKDLRNDVKIKIISIRGESNLEEETIEGNKCINYNLGAFKVEELFDEFKKRGFDLENKFDLIISRWCFRHLADPVGTFVQAYDLLLPEEGFFLIDGFLFLNQGESLGVDRINFNHRMTQLFCDIKATFLVSHYESDRSLNRFVLQKRNAAPCQLPLKYKGCKDIEDKWVVGSNCVTEFIREGSHMEKYRTPNYKNLLGDKKLYEFLKQKNLLLTHKKWEPLQDNEDSQISFPLHQAIIKGNVQEVQVCIDEGYDINESDTDGNTPLHLTIQQGNNEVFQFLLSQKPLLELSNGKRFTPLLQTVKNNLDGSFIRDLIHAGADINHEVVYNYKAFGHTFVGRSSPLVHAINVGNQKAIEILLEAKADAIDALNLTIEKQNYELFRYLLSKVPVSEHKVLPNGKTPLHLAAKLDKDGRFIRDLLKAGADINIKTDYRTPLSCAIEAGNQKAIEILLEAKAEAIDALKLTIEKQNYELFRYLLSKVSVSEHKVRPNVETPLHLAVILDRDGSFIRDLLQAGADINAKGYWGTPLFYANKFGNQKAIEILSEANAESLEANDEDSQEGLISNE